MRLPKHWSTLAPLKKVAEYRVDFVLRLQGIADSQTSPSHSLRYFGYLARAFIVVDAVSTNYTVAHRRCPPLPTPHFGSTGGVAFSGLRP